MLLLKVVVGSSDSALISFCRTTGCAVCVLPVLCHICSSQVDLLPLQEVALLSSGESISVKYALAIILTVLVSLLICNSLVSLLSQVSCTTVAVIKCQRQYML